MRLGINIDETKIMQNRYVCRSVQEYIHPGQTIGVVGTDSLARVDVFYVLREIKNNIHRFSNVKILFLGFNSIGKM